MGARSPVVISAPTTPAKQPAAYLTSLLLLPALRLDHRPEVMRLAILPLEAHAGPLFLRAEVAAVYDQTFFPTLHFQDELGDRSVGDSIKGGADATFDRVNAPDQDDVDLTLQVDDQIGQQIVGGAQIDRTLKRLV